MTPGRVLVTGSSGLVGTALAAVLKGSGHEVVPFDQILSAVADGRAGRAPAGDEPANVRRAATNGVMSALRPQSDAPSGRARESCTWRPCRG
jgi:nucleoside-diphosphate-sugar epimerase